MSILRQKKQKILRFLFGTFSATALMFTFQACYGPPQGGYPENMPEDEIVLSEEQDSLSVASANQEEGVYTLNDDDEGED